MNDADEQPEQPASSTAALARGRRGGEEGRKGAAAAARDVLARVARADAATGGTLSTRNYAERQSLAQLAKVRRDLLLARNESRQVGQGHEHFVEHSAELPGRVIKHTHSGFGFALHPVIAAYGGYLELREATPSEYMARLDAGNHVFGDDARIEGLSKIGGEIGFAISQRAIQGTVPEQLEIEKYLTRRGYEKVRDATLEGSHIKGKTWWNPKSGYVITDAKPDNFKKDAQGDIVPIDLIVHYAAPGSDMDRVLSTGGRF